MENEGRAREGDLAETALVIPCYDEERRLDADAVLRLARSPAIRVVLVDDGSRDGTRALLERIAERSDGRVVALAMPKNGGKGEAVRFGMRAAAGAGAPASHAPAFVGFADADFATPVEELVRLVEIARASSAAAVLGSRVAMAGRQIERKAMRHYVGRGFSTAASVTLGAPFYDTQCGAKIFRNTPLLRASLATPFRSRWIFDVELLARLLGGVDEHAGVPFDAFHEEPLRRWTDVAGSRVRLLELVDVGASLLSVGVSLRRRRARS